MTTEKLEAKIKELEARLEREEAVTQIQNLVGRYEIYHIPSMFWKTKELFALKTPGVSAEVSDWGVFEGAEGIDRLYAVLHHGGETRGTMFEHHLATPIIQVAKDGKTAKGVWFSPGCETMKDPETGEITPYWCWGKYGADFVKEDGEWKIWHWHWYRTFKCPYDTSWVDAPPLPANRSAEFAPDRETTYHNPYTPDSVREEVPAYPEPYDTWKD